jgi:hypothetical protein
MSEQKISIDIVKVREKIVKNLTEHGFRPHGADPSDFQFGTDPGLRFKVGTVYGEVTVTIWKYARQVKKPIRILNDEQAIEANHQIDALIHEFFSKRQVNG